jgi:DNA-binding LacI/PurR family transcriptional regulator
MLKLLKVDEDKKKKAIEKAEFQKLSSEFEDKFYKLMFELNLYNKFNKTYYLKIIEKTNFKPSLSSKRLLLKKNYNISLILNPTSSPFKDLFYFEITRGILEKSRELGYNIVIGEIYTDENGRNKLPDIIYSNDTDGVIFLQDISREIQNEIGNTGIPYLVVDSHSSDVDFTCVSTDYTEASYTAAKYLIGCGHKNIAFFTSSFIPDFYMQTFTGFKKAMDEAGLSIIPSHIQSNVKDETTAYVCMEHLLKNPKIPSAVLCTCGWRDKERER